jgi:hypothetical protein
MKNFESIYLKFSTQNPYWMEFYDINLSEKDKVSLIYYLFEMNKIIWYNSEGLGYLSYLDIVENTKYYHSFTNLSKKYQIMNREELLKLVRKLKLEKI